MRRVIIAAILAATTAQANEMPVFGFNGFSFVIEALKIRGGETPATVTERANVVCRSVGKTAEMQITDEISDFRARFHYICL
ncbi:MAG: hypothetical protein WA790_15880 [Sulfitobacter sp.]